jgi:pimeloyl-ACP methyl ester carboxylesterase
LTCLGASWIDLVANLDFTRAGVDFAGPVRLGIQMSTVDNEGEATVLDDSVKAMAIQTTVAVDANRDGSIKLDGSDATTPATPYQFWLNDGTDSVVGTGDPTSYQSSSAYGNSTQGRIVNQSDLQNYAHLEVQVPLGATTGVGYLSPGWSATIQYAATSGNPIAYLVPLYSNYATGMLTYMNDPTAAEVMGGRPSDTRVNTGEAVAVAATSETNTLPIVEGTQTGDASTPSAYLNYLFEGAFAGSGSVVVSWLYKGHVVVQNNFNLQLQTASKMYETVSAIDSSWIKNDTANGLPDLLSKDAPVIPTTLNDLTITNPYTDSSPLDNNVVVFVHGWRMRLSEMTSYANTAFKRLYWQGYNGRFVAFRWPTEWVDTDYYVKAILDHGNFDRSEQKAWNSAPALNSLLVSLDGQYGGYQNVNIFAHSMGNVVTSEALHITATSPTPTPIVNAYVAMQAAVPAEAYQPYAVNGSNDVYNNFMGTKKSYFADLNKAAPQMFNFYNPTDIAVGSGVTDKWNVNNDLKPDNGYKAWTNENTGNPRVPVSSPDYYRQTFTADVHLLYGDPSMRYEAFAFAAFSASGPLGGTVDVTGPFDKAKQQDVSARFGFGTDHSGEFDGTEQGGRRAFWFTMIDNFNLPHWAF